MSTALSYIFLATSIILLFLTYRLLISKRALERELSSIRARSPSNEIEELKRKALQEIEELKNLERSTLEEELRQKRVQNDEEITSKQALIDNLLEEYKKSQEASLTLIFEAERVAAQESLEELKLSHEVELFLLQNELSLEKAKIEQLRRNQEEITDALRRKAIETSEFNINLTDADRSEVEDLRTIALRYPRIRAILHKAVYEIYYAPEVKKLVSRVVGASKVMGIYRITSKNDGRIYIGKSVDIKERWITHFKRASGLETETQNLLYPEMRRLGFENFSFEIIERVEEERSLSSREKYWQEFYDAKSHGFSVR